MQAAEKEAVFEQKKKQQKQEQQNKKMQKKEQNRQKYAAEKQRHDEKLRLAAEKKPIPVAQQQDQAGKKPSPGKRAAPQAENVEQVAADEPDSKKRKVGIIIAAWRGYGKSRALLG